MIYFNNKNMEYKNIIGLMKIAVPFYQEVI